MYVQSFTTYHSGPNRSGLRVCLECEVSHDAKVAAGATNRPEQVRFLVLAAGNNIPIGKYDLGPDDIVDCEAMFG